MTHLIFFEKPDCGGNARQRAALRRAGHTLERRNLLTATWSRRRLLAFLGRLPVCLWFNRAAPRVKSGEIRPEMLDMDAALTLLLQEPQLLRRPLMQRTDNGQCHVGFETAAVHAWVGLANPPPAAGADLEACVSVGQTQATPS